MIFNGINRLEKLYQKPVFYPRGDPLEALLGPKNHLYIKFQ